VTGIQAGTGSRDSGDVEALITDRYLDSIFAAHARGADTGPVPVDADPGDAIRLAARRLASDLPRLHPSFRFEEALAAKLSLAAARMRSPMAVGASPKELPIAVPVLVAADGSTVGDALIRLRLDGPHEVGRPLLIGGAITSAALSLAGAAYVAWRIRHPGASPMVRAVRAVTRTRLA
jgi:hypothetical protein